MIYMAHRGNTYGPIPEHENTQAYIDDAIEQGFDVEIDVWGLDGRLWLGHDKPKRPVSTMYLAELCNYLWVHCKNVAALGIIRSQAPEVRHFFHQTDDYTMVSNGTIWCFPGKLPVPGSVVLLPESWMNLAGAPEYCRHHGAFGVCSDFIGELRKA